MARQQYVNGDQPQANPADYDFGPEVDEGAPYQGSQPAGFAPAQQQNSFGARRAVPPQGPDGRFVRDDRKPRRQAPMHPLQQSYRQQTQQEQFDDGYDQGGGSQPEQAYEHSRALVRRAVEVGFTDEEIDNLPSNQLDNLVWERKNQAIEEARRNATARAVQAPAGAQTAQQQQQAPVQEPDEEINFGEFEEVMDKGFVKSLKGQLQKQLKQLRSVEKQLLEEKTKNDARQQQETQRQQAIAFATRMDRLFARHAQFLGDERWDELQPGDAGHVKRQAVLNLAQADRSRRSDQEKIDYAVATLFGVGPDQGQGRGRQRLAQPRFRQPTQRQQEWEEAGLQRPTNRRAAPEVNGVRRAIQNVTQRLADMDDPGADGQVEYDDFLGGNNYQPYQ